MEGYKARKCPNHAGPVYLTYKKCPECGAELVLVEDEEERNGDSTGILRTRRNL